MRMRGQYIIDKRLKFRKGFQRNFLRKIKEKSQLSWSKLAQSFNLSEHTLKWDFYKEKSTLPFQLTKRMLKKYPVGDFEEIVGKSVKQILEENWGQKKAGGRNKKQIKFPKKSEELAEFLGVMLGDGHVQEKGIRITGNAFEKLHHEYIGQLISEMFGLEPRLYRDYLNPNTIVINVYSKNMVGYLVTNGLKVGDKIKNKVSFPEWIFHKRQFVFGALRGLFDTDGGIYYKQKKYRRAFIEFQTHSSQIRKDIFDLLLKAGLKPSTSSVNVRIQNQRDIHKFFNLIGSSNPKNIVRYMEFLKKQAIPLKEELTDKIINYSGKIPFKLQS